MMELVDVADSKSAAARHGGSSPSTGTRLGERLSRVVPEAQECARAKESDLLSPLLEFYVYFEMARSCFVL